MKIDYDSIEADKLILEFKCNSCHRTIVTDKLQVPEINSDGKPYPEWRPYQHQ